MNKTFSKAMLLVLGGFLLVGSTQPVQAYDHCSKRIHKAELKLERAIRRHGPNSRQAARQRENVERVRATCHR
jgi:hypothetical protein